MGKKSRKYARSRVLATADPDLTIRVVDSGWTAEEWAAIADAMSRYVPNGREPNVSRRGGGPAPEPSVASLLASRQIQQQLREASR